VKEETERGNAKKAKNSCGGYRWKKKKKKIEKGRGSLGGKRIRGRTINGDGRQENSRQGTHHFIGIKKTASQLQRLAQPS